MVVNFFTEQHVHTSPEPVRRQRKIAMIYIKGRFTIDFVALLPLKLIAVRWLGLSERHGSLLHLIKLLRIIVGFKLLSY